MKKINIVGKIAIVAVIAFLGSVFLSNAQEVKQGKAVVRAITKGTAKYKDPASGVMDWAPLKVDTVLKPGAVVETDATATVDLFLGVNGPVVRVTPGTQLVLDKLTFSRAGGELVIETQMDLKSGTILGTVKKLAAASKYEIKTPVGVCGIRGTEYRVSADGRVVVLKGWVRVTFTIQGQPPISIDVKEGQMVIPPTPTTPPQVVTIPENVYIETRAEIILSEKYVGAPPAAEVPVTVEVKPIERLEKDETQNYDSRTLPPQ